MPFLIRYWPHLLVIALAFSGGLWVGAQPANKRAAKAELALAFVQRDSAQQLSFAEAKARVTEHRLVNELAEVSEQHEVRIREIQAENDTRIGELIAGTKRLRHEIAAYATERLSRDSAAAGELSPDAQRGAALVGAAIGVGAACDAQIKGLQDAYEALRRPAP